LFGLLKFQGNVPWNNRGWRRHLFPKLRAARSLCRSSPAEYFAARRLRDDLFWSQRFPGGYFFLDGHQIASLLLSTL